MDSLRPFFSSLRWRLMLVLSACFACVVVIFAYLSFKHLNESEQVVLDYQRAMTGRIGTELEAQFDNLTHTLTALAAHIPQPVIEDPEQMQAWLQSRHAARAMFFDRGFFFLAADGESLTTVEAPWLSEHRAFVLKWMNHARELDEPVLSLPLWVRTDDARGRLVMIASVPIENAAGEVVGVLAGALNLERENILGSISQLEVGKNGYFFMLAWNGSLIMHPDFELMQRQGVNLVPWEMQHDVLTSGQAVTTEALGPDGRRVILSLLKLQSTGWILGSSQFVDEAYAPFMAQLLAQSVLIIIGLLVIGSIAIVLFHRLLAPIETLTRAMQRIDPEQSATLTAVTFASPTQEAALLQASFNDLLTRLADFRLAQSRRRFWLREGSALKFALSRCLQAPEQSFAERLERALSEIARLEGVLVTGGIELRWVSPVEGASVFRYGQPMWRGPAPVELKETAWVHVDCACGTPEHGHYWVPISLGDACYGSLVIDTHAHPPEEHERLVLLGELGEMLALAMLNERLTDMLRTAKADADAASTAKSQFMANMSHEIRTPMNGILGTLQLLDIQGLPPDQHELVRLAQDSASALLTIVNDILDFSKIEAGKLDIESIPYDLRQLAQDLVQSQLTVANQKSIRLTVSIAPEIPELVVGDPTRVRQVLLNLLSNALKFTAVGSVVLRVDNPQADTLAMSVQDSGMGMTPAVLAQLFQPFSQGDASLSRRFGGTGLGLSICKQLVELMGGSIQVNTVSGQGSTFTVYLPLQGVPEPTAD